MPFDPELYLARESHRRHVTEWTAAFVDQLQRLGSRLDPDRLNAVAKDAIDQMPGVLLEKPAIAARFWTEQHGLLR